MDTDSQPRKHNEKYRREYITFGNDLINNLLINRFFYKFVTNLQLIHVF